jgi:hypothetical protein
MSLFALEMQNEKLIPFQSATGRPSLNLFIHDLTLSYALTENLNNLINRNESILSSVDV